MGGNILFSYLRWHFAVVPLGILSAWKDVLLFNLDYFSVPNLARTLFAPWRRYQWSYGKGFNPQVWAEAIASNAISRILGAIVRSFVIVAGLIVEAALLVSGPPIVASWLLLPVITCASIIYGLIALL